MRSTRRIDTLATLGLLGLAALAIGGAIVAWPEAPDGPRYFGAGDETPRSGGTFVFHHESNVRSLDPHIAYDELSGMALRLLFDGLLDYDYDANLIPSLAESMPRISEDGKVFRFRLRSGVRFHPMPGLPEGRELTAEDVRWSIERLLHPDTGSPGFPFFKSIVGLEAFRAGEREHLEGVEVRDSRTVVFRLTEPDQTFLNAIAMPFAYPVPRENYEHWGAEASMHPVGTGPFVFERWERGVEVRFRRNERYWRPDRPNPDAMIFQEGLDRHVAMMRFRNGDLDAVHRQTTPDYHFLKSSTGWAPYIAEFPRASIFGIGMNCEMAPFDDVHFRRAVAFALDREGWSRSRAGRLQAAGQLLPPMVPGYDPQLASLQTFDLDRAREEMRLAGYPDGYPEEIPVWFTEGDTGRFYGELLQHDLAQIGIDIRIRQVSFSVYLQETGKPGTVPAFSTGWNMDFPDPSNFIDVLFNSRGIHPTNSENRAFYRNPELDRLLDEARAEVDRERRLSLYQQANEIVASDAPWAFAYYPMSMEAWQPYVKNYRPHPIWSEDYRDVWLDLPRRSARRDGPSARNRLATLLSPFGGLR